MIIMYDYLSEINFKRRNTTNIGKKKNTYVLQDKELKNI